MNLEKTVTSIVGAMTLGVSVPASATEAKYSEPVIELSKFCTDGATLILDGDGKDLCVKEEVKNIEVSLDNGATWHPLYGIGALALAFSTVGAVAFLTRKKTLPKRPSNRTEPKVSQESPVVEDDMEDWWSAENQKKEIAYILKEFGITHLDFQFLGEGDSTFEYINFCFLNRYFQVGVKKSGDVYFHWFDEPSKTMNGRGEWIVGIPDFKVTPGMIGSFLDVVKLYPLNSLANE